MDFIKKYLFLLAAFFVGCSDFATYEGSGDGKVEVIIGGSYAIPTSSTKTSIADDLQTAEWIPGDQIAVWAEGVAGFALSAECFKLRYYGNSYAKADFWASISPMEEGEYTYYGVYPYTSTYNNSAKTATFSLSATQSGEYDGVNDIMVAEPLTAQQELTGSALGADALKFSHLMHILRLEIPDGRNLFGMELTGMDISFSQNVVGDVTVDYTDPAAATTLANGESNISVVFDEPFETGDGKYIWVFMNPTTLSGEVTFIGYGEGGNKSQMKVTTSISGNFAAGKITPVRFTLPEPSTVTTFQVKVPHADVKTRIGETLQSVTFTAPSGLLIDGETNAKVFPVESDDMYEFYFYDLTAAQIAALNNGSLGVRLDTKSVYKTPAALDISGVTVGDTKLLSAVTVPYLVDPNIDKISGKGAGDEDMNNKTDVKDINGLSGWKGGQRSKWGNGWLMIRPYAVLYLFKASTYESRITTCAMSTWGIKSDASVTLLIKYNAVWDKNKTSGVSVKTGTTTTTDLKGAFVSSSTTSMLTGDGKKVTSVSATIKSVKSSHKLAMETSSTANSGQIALGYDEVKITGFSVTIVE